MCINRNRLKKISIWVFRRENRPWVRGLILRIHNAHTPLVNLEPCNLWTQIFNSLSAWPGSFFCPTSRVSDPVSGQIRVQGSKNSNEDRLLQFYWINPDSVRIIPGFGDSCGFSGSSTSMERLTPKVWKQIRSLLKLTKMFIQNIFRNLPSFEA